ncbi:2-aminoethanethiol dioxygenase [Biomphalaria glabrata]|uniref:2-aminoethanethiol dioxygenase-like n=1 Tax=Biomphalaria glabrata TaxID=6526 RepID=A0A9U8E667_BIOGL|nr:2-aminoethanethiol dioxygenase-like [Biomphalaria glabrata]KAI8769302.1 2-aminoethanethiol dioxygenase-like [Biomphalaria glabrata]KAI8789620.1 2-aminoethanethiol dioxygenase [Biomphalaria glabrata]
MATPIQKLANLSAKIFGMVSPDKITKEHLTPLIRAINEIKMEDVNFDVKEIDEIDNYRKHDQQEIAPVTYIHLHQDRTFTMSIFVLKSGGVIPLHDHPKMHGLLKVICGAVKIISYTEINKLPLPEDYNLSNSQSQPLTRSYYKNIKTVQKNNDIILTDKDDCCVLMPIEGNIHEIQPVTNIAAFLDILAPPYESDQSCHYYQELPFSKLNIKWLLEIPQPRSYWCDTLKYKGVPLFDPM